MTNTIKGSHYTDRHYQMDSWAGDEQVEYHADTYDKYMTNPHQLPHHDDIQTQFVENVDKEWLADQLHDLMYQEDMKELLSDFLGDFLQQGNQGASELRNFLHDALERFVPNAKEAFANYYAEQTWSTQSMYTFRPTPTVSDEKQDALNRVTDFLRYKFNQSI